MMDLIDSHSHFSGGTYGDAADNRITTTGNARFIEKTDGSNWLGYWVGVLYVGSTWLLAISCIDNGREVMHTPHGPADPAGMAWFSGVLFLVMLAGGLWAGLKSR